MSALALRDFILIRRDRSLIAVVLFSLLSPLFFAGGSAFGLAMASLPAYMVVALASGMDFKYGGDRFLCSLPVARAAIVAQRYASGLLAWAASFVVSLPAWAVAAFSLKGAAAAFPAAAIFSFASTAVMVGIYLAAYYAFGYLNARWAIFIVMVAFGAVTGALGLLPGADSMDAAAAKRSFAAALSGRSGAASYAAIAIAAAAAYGLSLLSSVAAYRRRQF